MGDLPSCMQMWYDMTKLGGGNDAQSAECEGPWSLSLHRHVSVSRC